MRRDGTMTEDSAPKPNRQDQRSQATRARVCRAAAACLDRYGYAETTFARVQAQAGLSRGAITHHFPNKQALVAATAQALLSNALEPVRAGPDGVPPVRAVIRAAWAQVVNSSGGRAMVEILVACRTDPALHALLRDELADWDRRSRAVVAQSYRGADPEADDAELLWSMVRNFLRGLILHERFLSDPAYLSRMVERFAAMMETQLIPRETAAPPAKEPAR